MECKVISRVFRPNWKLTLFYLLLLPVLVSLGFWQLQRAEYKQGLQDLYQQRLAAKPSVLSELNSNENIAYKQVQLQGHFESNHHFLLDNRVLNGRPGYEVISAFLLEPAAMMANGNLVKVIWVNRGWLAMQADRRQLPIIEPVDSLQIIHGQLIIPSQAFVLADVPMTGQWPEVVQRVELEAMNRRLQQAQETQELLQTIPYLLRLTAGEPGSFQVNWQPINTAPEKSLGYAVQWFLMALVLSGLYVWAGLKHKDS